MVGVSNHRAAAAATRMAMSLTIPQKRVCWSDCLTRVIFRLGKACPSMPLHCRPATVACNRRDQSAILMLAVPSARNMSCKHPTNVLCRWSYLSGVSSTHVVYGTRECCSCNSSYKLVAAKPLFCAGVLILSGKALSGSHNLDITSPP